MDLPHTVPMLKFFEEIKILHLEPTDVCQAACPLCVRETDPTFDKNIQNFLTPLFLENLLTHDVIKQLNKMYMCGVHGDPAASKYTLEIFKLFRDINPNIILGMNTNGAIQNTEWWIKIAKVLNGIRDYVVFSIDGLEDTNHIYRKNVNWKKLVENVEAFINAGGNAHWDMLVFEHNEHQVNACESMAKDLGFKYFRAKVSKRQNKVVNWIKTPKLWEDSIQFTNNISCIRNIEQSIYIDAKGNIFPCCWLSKTEFTIDKFDFIQLNWNTSECNSWCKTICSGLSVEKNNFHRQWKKEVQFF